MQAILKKAIVVLYHEACDDGFGAAWAAWRKFGDRARYVAVRYQESLPKGLSGKDVYLLDFSYPPDKMRELLSRARRVVAIDHHKTADVSTRMAQVGIFDLNHAGAVLAWRHFHPRVEVPRLLRHVEDRDLWRFKLPATNQIRAVLSSHRKDFETWDQIAGKLETGAGKRALIQEGSAILRYQERVVEQMVASAQLVHFCGTPTYVVNSPLLSSEVGHALSERLPPMGIAWSQRGDVVKVELRSIGEFDVSSFAKRFGGGGHKNAAGFSLPAGTPFPWEPIV
ncbi:MAG: phosphohydrolase [Deltaproteobacteria bacterium]|nr:phosphohydrolase [Deltaproteobacteria bacterium]